VHDNTPKKQQSFLDKHHFLLRRLHSLTGIFPIGLFLIPHLTTNSSILWGSLNKRADEIIPPGVTSPDQQSFSRGVATFWHEVQFINELPFLLLIEVALWLSIAYHAAFGVIYGVTGRGNTGRYKYQSNWRYTLQRWSGYIGIFFILYHIATLRWGLDFLVPGGTQWDHNYASATTAAAIQGSFEGLTIPGLIVSAFYMLGVTLLVFHFANGLWTAAITWGLTVTQKAQQRWGYVCAALGVGLMVAGWASVVGFATLDAEEAWKLEKAMVANKKADEINPPDQPTLEPNPNAESPADNQPNANP
jgi:succinate dehydrogenase / fumarate reductase cytochrome b subunit